MSHSSLKWPLLLEYELDLNPDYDDEKFFINTKEEIPEDSEIIEDDDFRTYKLSTIWIRR